MHGLSRNFDENIDTVDGILNIKENFDIIKRRKNRKNAIFFKIGDFRSFWGF